MWFASSAFLALTAIQHSKSEELPFASSGSLCSHSMNHQILLRMQEYFSRIFHGPVKDISESQPSTSKGRAVEASLVYNIEHLQEPLLEKHAIQMCKNIVPSDAFFSEASKTFPENCCLFYGNRNNFDIQLPAFNPHELFQKLQVLCARPIDIKHRAYTASVVTAMACDREENNATWKHIKAFGRKCLPSDVVDEKRALRFGDVVHMCQQKYTVCNDFLQNAILPMKSCWLSHAIGADAHVKFPLKELRASKRGNERTENLVRPDEGKLYRAQYFILDPWYLKNTFHLSCSAWQKEQILGLDILSSIPTRISTCKDSLKYTETLRKSEALSKSGYKWDGDEADGAITYGHLLKLCEKKASGDSELKSLHIRGAGDCMIVDPDTKKHLAIASALKTTCAEVKKKKSEVTPICDSAAINANDLLALCFKIIKKGKVCRSAQCTKAKLTQALLTKEEKRVPRCKIIEDDGYALDWHHFVSNMDAYCKIKPEDSDYAYATAPKCDENVSAMVLKDDGLLPREAKQCFSSASIHTHFLLDASVASPVTSPKHQSLRLTDVYRMCHSHYCVQYIDRVLKRFAYRQLTLPDCAVQSIAGSLFDLNAFFENFDATCKNIPQLYNAVGSPETKFCDNGSGWNKLLSMKEFSACLDAIKYVPDTLITLQHINSMLATTSCKDMDKVVRNTLSEIYRNCYLYTSVNLDSEEIKVKIMVPNDFLQSWKPKPSLMKKITRILKQ